MNAQELTKYVTRLESRITELEKRVKHLNHMMDAKVVQVHDLQMDIEAFKAACRKPRPVYLDKGVKK